MSGFQRVLFPVEISADYQSLTTAARKMFDRRDVEVLMLHVIEEPSRSIRGMEVARSMAQMEFLARREFELARSSRRVERGRAADCVLEYARNAGVDTILMPTGAPESLRREVVAAAGCAVWLDWCKETVETERPVCCAVTLASGDAAVLCRASEIAEELGAELTILHAVVPESPMSLWWDGDVLAQEVRASLGVVEDLREKFAPKARVHVEAGRVDWVVNQALHRLDAGLLIVAGGGEAALAGAMTCPVLRIEARGVEAERMGQAPLAATA